MSHPEQLDTSDMVSVHRVFREALVTGPRLARSAAAGSADASAVRSYLEAALRLLHAHHEGEDELLTPKLLDRAADRADTIRRIADQHKGVDGRISAAQAALGSWEPADSASTDALVDALDALRAELVAHLDEEERVVLPVAATHIRQEEWGELPGHAMRQFPPEQLWLVLGLVREQMTPAQVAAMDAHLPPPVASMWQSSGAQEFSGFAKRLRGVAA